jgi:hypothetical protein
MCDRCFPNIRDGQSCCEDDVEVLVRTSTTIKDDDRRIVLAVLKRTSWAWALVVLGGLLALSSYAFGRVTELLPIAEPGKSVVSVVVGIVLTSLGGYCLWLGRQKLVVRQRIVAKIKAVLLKSASWETTVWEVEAIEEDELSTRGITATGADITPLNLFSDSVERGLGLGMPEVLDKAETEVRHLLEQTRAEHPGDEVSELLLLISKWKAQDVPTITQDDLETLQTAYGALRALAGASSSGTVLGAVSHLIGQASVRASAQLQSPSRGQTFETPSRAPAPTSQRLELFYVQDATDEKGRTRRVFADKSGILYVHGAEGALRRLRENDYKVALTPVRAREVRAEEP